MECLLVGEGEYAHEVRDGVIGVGWRNLPINPYKGEESSLGLALKKSRT